MSNTNMETIARRQRQARRFDFVYTTTMVFGLFVSAFTLL
jgi:hypothetical protein